MEQPPPTMMPQDYQRMRDAEHIRLLAIFHYVYAGLLALGASIPIIHVTIGVAMVSGKMPMGPTPSSGPPPPDMSWMGWLFVLIGGSFVVIGWTVAVLTFFAGRALTERRRRTLVFVMACVNCLNVPLGTALGIFTILVLQRPSVMALFEEGVGGRNARPPYLNA